MREVAAQPDERDGRHRVSSRPIRRRPVPRRARRRRHRSRVLAPAAARAAALLRRLVGLQHRLALVRRVASWKRVHQSTSACGTSPDLAAQREEVVGGAKARVLEQAVRPRAGALLEARLQRPDLLDRRLEAARDRDALAPAPRARGPSPRTARAAAFRRAPSRRSTCCSTSCHSSVANRNAGDTGLPSRTRASVLGERDVDEARAERLLEDHVEQRQQAVRQPVRAQARERLRRVARQQQLLHLVEQARGRHVLDEARELRDRRRGLGVDRDADLRREPHGAQHPHRVLAKARDRRADQLQPPRADVGARRRRSPRFPRSPDRSTAR